MEVQEERESCNCSHCCVIPVLNIHSTSLRRTHTHTYHMSYILIYVVRSLLINPLTPIDIHNIRTRLLAEAQLLSHTSHNSTLFVMTSTHQHVCTCMHIPSSKLPGCGIQYEFCFARSGHKAVCPRTPSTQSLRSGH